MSAFDSVLKSVKEWQLSSDSDLMPAEGILSLKTA